MLGLLLFSAEKDRRAFHYGADREGRLRGLKTWLEIPFN